MKRPRLGLTARGSALMTAGLTALVCGYVLGQRDLVRVAVLLTGTPIIASVMLSRSRISISLQRSAEPNRVPPGVPILLRISLTNQSILPIGSLMLEDRLGPPFEQRARFTLDSLRGRETRTLTYQLPPAGRGDYRVGPLTMRLADPFGLVERPRSFRSVSDLLVLPALDPLPHAPLPGAWDSSLQAGSHAIGSHGSNDASIRQYRYGDDLRKVHWRSTARLGEMMMRQEERPWHGSTSVLFDARGRAHRRLSPAAMADLHRPDPRAVGVPSVEPRSTDRPFADPFPPELRSGGPGTGEPGSGGVSPAELGSAELRRAAADPRRYDSFEWGLSAAASVATHLQGRGRNLDLMAGELVLRSPNAGLMLDRMARLTPSRDQSLAPALSAADSGGEDSNIFAVLGALDEAALRLLTRRQRSPGSALALLLDTPTWATTDAATRIDRDAGVGVRTAEAALTAAGWRVQVVRAGTPIADAWLALMNQATAPAFRLATERSRGRA